MPWVCVAGRKGGVGKTTVAAHLWAAAAELGPAHLLDADEQGSATRWLEEAGLGQHVTALDPAGTRALPSLRGADNKDTLIDTPPGDRELTLAALRACDLAVCPIRPTLLEVDRIGQTLQIAADAGVAAVVLLNQVRRTKLSEEVRQALDEAKVPVLGTVVPLRAEIEGSFGKVPMVSWLWRDLWAEIVGLVKIVKGG